MSKPKVPKVEFGGDYHTSQIYSMGYEFAFMSRKPRGTIYRQATPFVYCKDFLHDAVWAFLHQTKVQVFGFKYDYQKNKPLFTKRTALAFRNTQFKGKEKEFHAKISACAEFLQRADQKLGFRPTEIIEVPHSEGPCWLIIADAGWQHAPPMLSLFTLLVRVGCVHTPGATFEQTLERVEKGEIKVGVAGAGTNDNGYVQQSRKGIDAILRHGLAIFHSKQLDNYPKEIGTHELHDNYGIVNFTRRRPEKKMPHWYRPEIWG